MRVAIVGIGQTKYEVQKRGQSIPEMVYEAVMNSLNDAELTINDIDNIVTASVDLWDGRTASNVLITEVVGAVMKPETRVANDGLFAVLHALLSILSGSYNLSLVVAHCKPSESSHFELSNWVFDPIYQQPIGLDYLSGAALQAKSYMSKYGITEQDCAKVVVKNRKNAKDNPFVEAEEVSVDDVLNSEMLALPIKELDIQRITDGACAIILASEAIASNITKKPVWVKGFGHCIDAHYLGDRVLSDSKALGISSKKAYKMAGIENPKEDIDIAEISEEFSYQELLWSECLGLCECGDGAKFLNTGMTQIDGEIPINPSGGSIAGNPPFVSGMVRLAETVLQIRGEAEGHQVEDVKTALAHGVSGPAGQSHCIVIVGDK